MGFSHSILDTITGIAPDRCDDHEESRRVAIVTKIGKEVGVSDQGGIETSPEALDMSMTFPRRFEFPFVRWSSHRCGGAMALLVLAAAPAGTGVVAARTGESFGLLGDEDGRHLGG